ncbi:MAG: cell division protein FtsW [Myxococcota bacterium]|jgi:cell division protein FtsW
MATSTASVTSTGVAPLTAEPVSRTSAVTPRTGVNVARPWDPWLLLPIACLLGLGVVMVYSASIGVADMRFEDPSRFLRTHLAHVGLGVVMLVIGMSINYQRHKQVVHWILGVSALLLLLTLFVGINRGRSTRWLNLGVFELQAAEVAKLSFVIWLAYSLEKKLTRMETFVVGWLPHLMVCFLLMGLCFAQPDLGTCIVLAVVLFGMLWVAGSRASYVFAMALAVVPVVIYAIAGSSGRMKRVMAWLNPWEDRYGAGYQTVSALTSLASGGVSGLGLGNGRQKMGFLTQGWTDFIFSSIGEELGLIGTMAVALAFGVIMWRGFRAARLAPDHYGRFLAFGITLLVGIQATFNMGVAVGLVPTKGLNLPLVSGGGSSMLMTCLALGILLNVSRFAESPGAFAPLPVRRKVRKKKPAAQARKPHKPAVRKPKKPISQRQSGVRPFTRPGGDG